MIDVLIPGDVILVDDRGAGEPRQRIVVSVIDTDGARGGIVDTKDMDGVWSRTAGYVLGDEIIAVVSMAKGSVTK
jgi:hypothetical protein